VSARATTASHQGLHLKSGNEAVWDKIIELVGPRPVSAADPEQRARAASKRRFRDRGLSAIIVRKLIEAGIDAPERLLFMSVEAIAALDDIGPKRMIEIDAYRAKYLQRADL
jgi:hypothetical protein